MVYDMMRSISILIPHHQYNIVYLYAGPILRNCWNCMKFKSSDLQKKNRNGPNLKSNFIRHIWISEYKIKPIYCILFRINFYVLNKSFSN